ncbi:MAG TPA: ATP-binding protein [Anaeromyxobacteraceae bacterium]|nr:ATP-binding protein [Anaeromyxobacteraceae bacterium]
MGAARTTEDRLRALLNEASSVFFVLDAQGTVLLAEGRGLRALLGRRKGEDEPGPGRSVFEIYGGVPWVAEGVRRALGGRTVTCGGRVGDRWWEARFAPVRDERGRVVEIVGLATDVTHRRAAEEALRTERDFSDAVLETSGALVLVLDREGRIVRFNRACEEVTGWRFHEVQGRAFFELFLAPEELDEVRAVFARLLAKDFPSHHENHWVARDGSRRLVTWSNTALLDEAGEVLHVVSVGIDVSERRRAEEALRRQAARLAALAEASRVFAAGLDYKATLDTVARRLAETIGDGTLIRVVSQDGDWLVPVAVWHPNPERLALRRRILAAAPQRTSEGITARVLESGEPLRVPRLTREFVHERMKPEYWAYLDGVTSMLIVPLALRREVFGHITLMRDGGGAPYTAEDEALLQDLAHRAAQAIENARLYGEARAAVAARDEFLSIASHELRTPLTALKLALENMRRVASPEAIAKLPPAYVHRVLDTAERQGQRLEKLVTALLDVSRIHMGRLELEFEEVDLAAVVAESVSQLEDEAAQAGSSIEVKGAAVRGEWDRLRVGQIVTNLLSNAVKYGAGKPVDVEFTGDGERARIVVRDRGIGIAATDQRQIFERFERAVSSRNYGGLGLGLYIVRRIVEAHGGTIRVESEPGEGAAFFVDLPLRAAPHPPPPEDRVEH